MAIQFHKTIVTLVSDNSYRIGDDDLGTLLKTKRAAGEVDAKLGDDVFRVMLRRAKDADGDAVEAFETAYKGILDVGNAVLIGPEIQPNPDDPKEEKARKTKLRQQATGFIRSAGSVLRTYVKRERTLDALDPETHGKAAVEALNKAATTDGTDASGKTTEERVVARISALLKSLRDMHAEDPARGNHYHTEAVRMVTDQFNSLNV